MQGKCCKVCGTARFLLLCSLIAAHAIQCQGCSFCHKDSVQIRNETIERNTSENSFKRLVLLASHENGDAVWAHHAPYQLVVMSKAHIPNTGLDASTYLWWIIANYHALPAWCLFMHNHEYHWHHPKYSQLISMVINVEKLGCGYLNVAHDKSGLMQVYHKGALLELNTSENEQVKKTIS